MADRAEEAQLACRRGAGEPHGDGMVGRGTPRQYGSRDRAAGVVRDELHLGHGATHRTDTPSDRDTADPAAGLAPPLLRERLDEDSSVHVER